MANICPICGGKLGLLNREKSADGLICAGCSNFFFSKLGIRAAKQPTAALADYWATLECRRKAFKETDSSMMVTRSLCRLTNPTGCFISDTAAVIKALV